MHMQSWDMLLSAASEMNNIYTFRKWACSWTPGVLKVLERAPIAITR